jgi:hypothetical protein
MEHYLILGGIAMEWPTLCERAIESGDSAGNNSSALPALTCCACCQDAEQVPIPPCSSLRCLFEDF